MILFKNVLTVFAAALATLLALPASAQTTRPGLWEITSKMSGNPEMEQAMAQMQKQMASMPPEQRKMMEDMMAKQGMSVGVGGNGFSTKICVTKEMAARNQLPVEQEGDCKNVISEKTSTGAKMTYSCTNPPSSGEGRITFNGDTGYTMKMKVNTKEQGKTQTTLIDGTGKFLAADCGNIKPIALPPVGK